MKLHPQILKKDGQPTFVVLPYDEYTRLLEEVEDLEDQRLYDEAKRSGEEFWPSELVDRLLAGENPVKVFREHRRMTQRALAEALGITQVYLSQIETGRRRGSTRVMKALAGSLRVDLDDLVPG